MSHLKERVYLVPRLLKLLAAMAEPADEYGDFRELACVVSQEDAVLERVHLYSTDGRVAASLVLPREEIPPAPDCRYPDIDQVIPKTPPVATIRVDPARLRKVLDLAEACDPEGRRGVTMEWRGPDQVIVFRVGHDLPGCGLVGLCMPLTGGRTE